MTHASLPWMEMTTILPGGILQKEPLDTIGVRLRSGTPHYPRRCAKHLDALPEEGVFTIACWLDPQSVNCLVKVNQQSATLGRSDSLWKQCGGQLQPYSFMRELDLSAALCGHVASCKINSMISWQHLVFAAEAASKVLVVDVGFGYTKWGCASADRELFGPPKVLQLCSSPTHPADTPRSEQIRFLVNSGDLHKERQERRVLIAEPFSISSEAEATAWRKSFVDKQLASDVQCLCFPQPLLALLAHGVSADGIVINVGHKETIIVPCLNGQVYRECSSRSVSLGAVRLTELLLDQLSSRNRDVVMGTEELTWCRDMKERYCAVSPAPLHAGDDSEEPSIELYCHEQRLELGQERYRVPEILFQPGQEGLPGLVINAVTSVAASSAPQDRTSVWQRLLSSVIVVGGTAELQGLHERLEADLRDCLEKPEFRKLNGLVVKPNVHVRRPLSTTCSPKHAVFHGAEIAAVMACAHGLFRDRGRSTDQPTKQQQRRPRKVPTAVKLPRRLRHLTNRMCSRALPGFGTAFFGSGNAVKAAWTS